MDFTCPSCHELIGTDYINTIVGVARCPHCGTSTSFSLLIEAADSPLPEVDCSNPPKGAWFEQRTSGFCVGATTRSWAALLALLAMIGWLIVLLNDAHRNAAAPASRDLTAIVAALVLAWISIRFAMLLDGKVEIEQTGDRLEIFTGVEVLGWRRRYAWSDFSRVRVVRPRTSRGAVRIVLEGKRSVRFGTLLNANKRRFLASVLQKMLPNSVSAPPSNLPAEWFR